MIEIEFTATTQEITFKIWDVDMSALYPKSYGVYKSQCSNCGENHTTRIFTAISAGFQADKVNGGKNETGMNRLIKFVKATRKMDAIAFRDAIPAHWKNNWLHELPTAILEAAK